MLWMMRAGMVLQFLSLWLVTPGIIGERRMNDAIEAINRVPDKVKDRAEGAVFVLVVSAGGGVVFAIFSGLTAIVQAFQTPGLIFAPPKEQSQFLHNTSKWTLIVGISIIALCLAAAIIAIFLYFVTLLFCIMVEKATESMQALAILGAILFTTGFVLSFVATLMPQPTPPATH